MFVSILVTRASLNVSIVASVAACGLLDVTVRFLLPPVCDTAASEPVLHGPICCFRRQRPLSHPIYHFFLLLERYSFPLPHLAVDCKVGGS